MEGRDGATFLHPTHPETTMSAAFWSALSGIVQRPSSWHRGAPSKAGSGVGSRDPSQVLAHQLPMDHAAVPPSTLRKKSRRDAGLCSHSELIGLQVLDRRTIKCAVDDAG